MDLEGASTFNGSIATIGVLMRCHCFWALAIVLRWFSIDSGYCGYRFTIVTRQ